MNKEFIEILLSSLVWFFSVIAWMPNFIVSRQKDEKIDAIFSAVGFYGSLIVSLFFLVYAFGILLYTP